MYVILNHLYLLFCGQTLYLLFCGETQTQPQYITVNFQTQTEPEEIYSQNGKKKIKVNLCYIPIKQHYLEGGKPDSAKLRYGRIKMTNR
jgi:hypothetical protein